jgi:hypothetical protein
VVFHTRSGRFLAGSVNFRHAPPNLKIELLNVIVVPTKALLASGVEFRYGKPVDYEGKEIVSDSVGATALPKNGVVEIEWTHYRSRLGDGRARGVPHRAACQRAALPLARRCELSCRRATPSDSASPPCRACCSPSLSGMGRRVIVRRAPRSVVLSYLFLITPVVA